jgi:hypothetical protein
MELLNLIKENFQGKIDIYPRREDLFQLILPVYHEDGDMVDVYIKVCSDNKEKIRILDCGMTLMKLSYTYDINSPSKENIFNTILNQSGIFNQDGELYLDTSAEFVYQNIMQFVGCQQKILNMRLWQREVIRSLFFEKLEDFIESDMKRFNPKKAVIPLKDYPVIEVDYSFEFTGKPFYLFGVNNKDKAKNAAIALLEFQKANLSFISLIVHENIQELPKKEQIYLTQNADKQFPTLENFQEGGAFTIDRLAA